MMENRKRSHAYMLVGAAGEVSDAEALSLAAGLLCSQPDAPCGRCRDCRKIRSGAHPDVIWVRRTNDDKGHLRREIVIEQIRAVIAEASVMPNEAQGKVFIIREADRMNPAAQNALLKSLEDPPGQVSFILCAASADALLETVRSRCVRRDLHPASETPAEDVAESVREYLRLAAAGNDAELMVFCMEHAREDADWAVRFFAALRALLCEGAAGREALPAGLSPARGLELSALSEEMDIYLRHNVGVRQVMGLLAARTHKENE